MGTGESQLTSAAPRLSALEATSALARQGLHGVDGKEENVVEVFHVEEGRKTCKVGYLAKHLAFRSDRYDGLCACITEVYSGDRTVCENAAKRLKFHRNS